MLVVGVVDFTETEKILPVIGRGHHKAVPRVRPVGAVIPHHNDPSALQPEKHGGSIAGGYF